MVIDRVITNATTIHDDRVATSSLTIEVEAVTLCPPLDASRGDSRTTQAIIFTDSTNFPRKMKSGMGNPDLNVSMVDSHFRKLLWMYCPGHAGVKGND